MTARDARRHRDLQGHAGLRRRRERSLGRGAHRSPALRATRRPSQHLDRALARGGRRPRRDRRQLRSCSGCLRRAPTSRAIAEPLLPSARRALRADPERRSRVRLVPRRLRGGRRGGRRRPALRDRARSSRRPSGSSVRLVRTVETHTHADHVSGHGRLALEHELPVSIHPAAQVDYPHDPLEDGDELTVGTVTLRVHPHAGPPARALLPRRDRHGRARTSRGSSSPATRCSSATRRAPISRSARREGAEGLFHSLRRLIELPDGVEVFPGHVAGSLCGVAMSSRGSTTIGFERRFNPMASIAGARRVRRRVRRRLGAEAAEPRADRRAQPRAVPRRAARRRRACRSPRRTRSCSTCARSPTTSPATARGRSTSPSPARASRRRPASCSMRPRRSRCSPPTRPRPRGRSRGLRSVAFLDIAGLRARRRPRGRPRHATVDELEGLIEAGATVVDVREQDERDEGYIPGSRNVPYRLMRDVLPGPARRPADRHDLQLGPARGDRREHPPREGPRRAPGRRRRHGRLARPRRDDGQLPPLRELTRRFGVELTQEARRRAEPAEQLARAAERALPFACPRAASTSTSASSCGAPISRSVAAASAKRPDVDLQRRLEEPRARPFVQRGERAASTHPFERERHVDHPVPGHHARGGCLAAARGSRRARARASSSWPVRARVQAAVERHGRTAWSSPRAYPSSTARRATTDSLVDAARRGRGRARRGRIGRMARSTARRPSAPARARRSRSPPPPPTRPARKHASQRLPRAKPPVPPAVPARTLWASPSRATAIAPARLAEVEQDAREVDVRPAHLAGVVLECVSLPRLLEILAHVLVVAGVRAGGRLRDRARTPAGRSAPTDVASSIARSAMLDRTVPCRPASISSRATCART